VTTPWDPWRSTAADGGRSTEGGAFGRRAEVNPYENLPYHANADTFIGEARESGTRLQDLSLSLETEAAGASQEHWVAPQWFSVFFYL
jgi:hypothetical protein